MLQGMILKHGRLFVCQGSSSSYGGWEFSSVSLSDDNVLKIESCVSLGESATREYHLSPEWFIITPRKTTADSFPPLPANNKQDALFALSQPPEITVWFSTSSKYERNQWIEKILPAITLKPPSPPEPPPPYSEYDNLSYFPWDSYSRTTIPEHRAKDQNAFHIPRPSLPRSGFYSLERPIKKQPQLVKPAVIVTETPPPAEPQPIQESIGNSHQCVNCCSLGCAFICNTLSVCLQMCCTNISTAL